MNNRTFHYTGHEARLWLILKLILDSDAFPGVFGGGSGGRCALRKTLSKFWKHDINLVKDTNRLRLKIYTLVFHANRGVASIVTPGLDTSCSC